MMLNIEQRERFAGLFPFLAKAPQEFQRVFFDAAVLVRIPAGRTIAEPGSECSQLALLLNGSVRVYKLGARGREITLYRVKNGDSCVLTVSCLLGDASFPCVAVTESEVDAVIVPANHAKAWMTICQPWSAFVFGLISQRLVRIVAVIESVTFQRMDVRIVNYLIDHAQSGESLNITHQEIASDLGTSREVVSRALKELDKKGLIKMVRGEIKIRDAVELRRLADNV